MVPALGKPNPDPTLLEGSGMEHYPAAAGGNSAAAGANPAAAGANPAAPGAIPAAPGAIPAAPGAIPDAPNPGCPVTVNTLFGNLSFNLIGQQRVVFMIFVAICILLGVAYMIMKLVEEGEGKNKHG